MTQTDISGLDATALAARVERFRAVREEILRQDLPPYRLEPFHACAERGGIKARNVGLRHAYSLSRLLTGKFQQ